MLPALSLSQRSGYRQIRSYTYSGAMIDSNEDLLTNLASVAKRFIFDFFHMPTPRMCGSSRIRRPGFSGPSDPSGTRGSFSQACGIALHHVEAPCALAPSTSADNLAVLSRGHCQAGLICASHGQTGSGCFGRNGRQWAIRTGKHPTTQYT